MTKEQREEMERLAEIRSKRQCATGQSDLDKAISWYLKIGFEDGFTEGVESEHHISNMLTQEIRKVLPSPTMDGMDKWNHTQKQIYHILERHYAKYYKGGGNDE